MPTTPENICSRFRMEGSVVSVIPITRGHINDSYIVNSGPDGQPCYLLQRINHSVFRNVEGLMSNIAKVLSHLEGRIRCSGETGFVPLHLIPVTSGGNYYRDPDGNFWRMYNYIPGSISYDVAGDPQVAREAGRAFGIFQELTSDIEGASLIETIPDFHNIAVRIRSFREILQRDRTGRVAETREEIQFVEERADEMHTILDLISAGKIPLRVTHNDTKINNILFDSKGKAVCIVDLDTVMPGSPLYDFGDAIRTGTSSAAEDEEDLSKVRIRMELFSAYAEGYLSVANAFLNATETRHLAFSARFMTYLIGLRFLTDYIDGDHYYRISHPSHNLVRARSQFRLVRSMEEQSEQMEQIISQLASKKT